MTKPFLTPERRASAALILTATLATVGPETVALVASGGCPATAAVKIRTHGLQIRDNLTRQFAPGISQPLNLRLTNPYRFSLKIKRLTVAVSVDARHAAAGCRASSNFKVTRLAKRAYPIRLRPRRMRSLRALRVKRLPRVAMRDLATNQDACKGARLKLRYSGRASRWQRRHKL